MSTDAKRRKSRRFTYIVFFIVIAVLAVLIFAYLNYPGGSSRANVMITGYIRETIGHTEIEGGDFDWTWRINLTVANMELEDVSGAELVVELNCNDRTISSARVDFNVSANFETTVSVIIGAKQSEFQDKDCFCTATIFLANLVLDQYTVSW